MSSNVSTPCFGPTTSPTQTQTQIQPPSPASAGATWQILDEEAIPSLSLDVLESRDDKLAALKLVAGSIAQQQQVAARALVFHPLCLSVLAVALAVVYRLACTATRIDPALALTLASGVAMSYLLAIRYLTAPYVQRAEDLRWDWLPAAPGGDEDLVLGTRFGGQVIGALVLRLAPGPGSPGRRARRVGGHSGPLLRGGRGVIRAWTTAPRYRGRGVGGDMLRAAVRATRERCGRDAEVGFAREHANSAPVLPAVLSGFLRSAEVRATRALEAVLAEADRGKRRR